MINDNIITQTQQRIVDILQDGGIPAIAENSLDVEFEVKSALAKQGIACIVATPELEHQGNNGTDLTWDCTIEVQFIENPIINRARLKKQGLVSGTALDMAVQAADALAQPYSYARPKYSSDRIYQSVNNELVMATLTVRTLC